MSLAVAANIDAESINEIVDILFPRYLERGKDQPMDNVGSVEKFANKELIAATRTLRKKQAPDLDGIPPKTIKIAA